MTGHAPSDPALDDWFDEPQPRGARGVDGPTAEDDWLGGETRPRRERRGSQISVGRLHGWQVFAAGGAALLLLLLIGLAAGGVFSSSNNTTTPPPIVSPTTSTPAQTTPPPAATTTPTHAPTTTLSPGASGPQVKVLQHALTALGYSPGKADGVYGPSTKQAVMEFQKAQGLTQDGVVGPKTLSALKQALTAKSG
jgi:hypothetical protein